MTARIGVVEGRKVPVHVEVRHEGRVTATFDAVFVEVKTPRGADGSAQGLRRARAWFQVFAATPWGALGDGPLDRAQEHP